VLDDDPRVLAAWLDGSFGRGVDDAWSDLDLHLVIEDEALDAFVGNRLELYRKIGDPLLIQKEMASPTQSRGLFQLVFYPGPVEVDWIIGPASTANRPQETRMLIARGPIPIVAPRPATGERRTRLAQDRLTFFWAMAPIAVKYAGRGDTRRAVTQIELLTGSFIVLWRLVHAPDGPDPTAPGQNRATEPDLDAILPRVGREIDLLSALEVIRQLCHEVCRLHDPLSELDATVSGQLTVEVEHLANVAEEAVRDPSSNGRRVYR
jgi:hypothetical protein